jgi:hypothetical protein
MLWSCDDYLVGIAIIQDGNLVYINEIAGLFLALGLVGGLIGRLRGDEMALHCRRSAWVASLLSLHDEQEQADDPNPEEIAEQLEVPVEEVKETLMCGRSVRSCSSPNSAFISAARPSRFVISNSAPLRISFTLCR